MEETWESHKSEIRSLYLVENWPLTKLIAKFKDQYDLDATKRQWTKKLEKWGFRKSLDEAAGTPSPPLPENNTILVCTPPQIPLPSLRLWPEDLPWFRFRRHAAQILTSSGRLGATHSVSRTCSCPPQPEVNASATVSRVLATLMFPPHKFAAGDVASHRHSVAEVHELFSRFMPEQFPDEHLTRVEQMVANGTQAELVMSIEVLLYFFCNNLSNENIPSRSDRHLVELCEHLSQKKVFFEGMFRLKGFVVQALKDALFRSAINLARVDILRELERSGLDIASRISGRIATNILILRPLRKTISVALPLHIALGNGDVDLVDFLLSKGADFHSYSIRDNSGQASYKLSSIECSVMRSSSQDASIVPELVGKVLRYQQTVPELDLIRALAFMAHNVKKVPEHIIHIENAATQILERLLKLASPSGLNMPTRALIFAIRYGHTRLIETLVSRGKGLDQHERSIYFTETTTPLWEAVRKRNYAACRMLLEANVPPDPRSCDYTSALQYAAFLGDSELAGLFLSHGAKINRYCQYSEHDVNMRRVTGRSTITAGTPLMAAIRGGQIQMVRDLMRMGARLAGGELRCALESKNSEIVHHLLDAGVQPFQGALVEAIRHGNVDLVQRLTESGADLWKDGDAHSNSPLAMAIVSGYTAIVDRILTLNPRGYDPVALMAASYVAARTNDRSLVPPMLDRRVSISMDERYIEGMSLAISVYFGDQLTAAVLLEHGVCLLSEPWYYTNVYLLDRFSLSASGFWDISEEDAEITNHVLSLIGVAVNGGQRDMLRFLLQNGHRPTTRDLCRAVQVGSEDIFKVLLHETEDLNDRIAYEDTILQGAIKRGWTSVLPPLLGKGIDINAPAPRLKEYRYASCNVADYGGYASPRLPRTALQAAAANGNLGLVSKLIDMGADLNAPPGDWRGATALQLASILGYIGIAKVLVDAGADCDASPAQFYGRTALEGAAEHGRLDIVHYLLSVGARTDGTARVQYFRAIKFAQNEGHFAVAELLRKHRSWTDMDYKIFEKTSDADDYKYYL